MINELTLLIVDDDDVACEAISRSLRKTGLRPNIVTAENGKEALDILRGQGSETITLPFIVLLDLNMPVMNGLEFLETVRNDLKLMDITVFVLTTSDDDRDRSAAYFNNVAGYMVKSHVGPQFSKLANLLQAYSEAVVLKS